MYKRRVAAGLATALLAASFRATGQCIGYSVDIYAGPQGCQILPSWAGAFGINDAGDMCGAYNVCGGVSHHVIWSATGQITEMPPSADGGIPDTPREINSSGQVVGRMHVVGQIPPDRAFLYSNGITQNLGTLPGQSTSEALAIAADGVVVGSTNGSGPKAFIWKNGSMNPMLLPIGPDSVARDVSDSGLICGWMGIAPHVDAHAFIYDHEDDMVLDLGTVFPDAIGAQATSINNFGTVCGVSFVQDKRGLQRRSFMWQAGEVQELLPLPGFLRTFERAINDSTVVVGSCDMWPTNAISRAFVWQNGVMQALEDLIPPELNLSNLNVWDINNAGQIAGYANRPSPIGAETVAVRLTPIPAIPGDFNCDSQVNVLDLLGIINHWGYTNPNLDFNADGTVNLPDLIIVLNNWTF